MSFFVAKKTTPRLAVIFSGTVNYETNTTASCLLCDEEGEVEDFPNFAHRCFPNAGFLYDKWQGRVVVFAEREIQEGEEISINYSCFYDFDNFQDPAKHKERLLKLYQLDCGGACQCSASPEVVETLRGIYILDKSLYSALALGNQEEAEILARRITRAVESEGLISRFLYRAYFDMFQILNGNLETREEARKFARQCLELVEMLGPNALLVKQLRKYVENPESHMSAKVNELLRDENGQLHGFDLFGGGSDDEFHY